MIREVSLEDIDNGLLEVYIEGYRHHHNGRPDIFVDLSFEQLRKDLIENLDRLSTIVYIENDRVVGYLSYVIKKRHTKKLDVDQLVVKDGLRGKGIGKKLMAEVKKIATDNDCDRIELNCWNFNENSLAMYEHIGYKKQRIMYEMKLK